MRKDDTAKQKSMSLFFVFVRKGTFILSSEEVKQIFEMHHVGRVQFYWHYSKAVTVI